MRIAEISTLARPVPPAGEGSVESLVSAVTEALVQRGHAVTLYATADSKTAATLRSPVPRSYTQDPAMWDWGLYEAYQAREAFLAWRDFDVLHCHAYHYGLLFCDFVPAPSVHSIHIEPGPDYLLLARRTTNRHLVFCSRYQAREFAGLPNVHIVPHGIDVSAFDVAPPEEREDYAVFLGRMIPEKGPLEAIAAARAAGLRLLMAAPTSDYYRQAVAPLVDGDAVVYLGEVAGAEKARLLARAHALLYPVTRGEPFGLVLIEAMACGLPVVASATGATPEIIEHGVTGYLAATPDELARGLREVATLDRRLIRRAAEDRYTVVRMVDGLEAVLRAAAESP